jgi:hypothetical protein
VKATVFEMERLRCNACCQVFTAAEPAGVGAGKYDVTAVAMIALLKARECPSTGWSGWRHNSGFHYRQPLNGS